jgi:hypothetical protein
MGGISTCKATPTLVVGSGKRSPVIAVGVFVPVFAEAVSASPSFFGSGFDGCVQSWNRFRSRASGLGGAIGAEGFCAAGFFAGTGAGAAPAPTLTDTPT